MEPTATTYDHLPYDDKAFPATHPDHLAVIGLLHGMNPPAVDQARVLELGCGSGGNLIPMAYAIKAGRFLGIDLSQRQIAAGHQVIDRLALRNIELRRQDILDFDTQETFDFILCHGVYSWVPSEVQHRILQICRQRLAPNGLAYVSYNIYPGWHLDTAIRDILRFGARGVSAPDEQVNAALEYLQFVAAHLREPEEPFGLHVRKMAKTLPEESRTYVFHEYLEACNSPVYFEQFARCLAEAGLQYVDDAVPSDAARQVGGERSELPKQLAGDGVHHEQSLDFLSGRAFRRSILCHREVRLQRELRAEALRGMQVLSASSPASQTPDLLSFEPEQFCNREGVKASTNMPVLKTALVILHEAAPRAVPFDELWQAVCLRLDSRVPQRPDADIIDLAWPLLACAMGTLAGLHVDRPPIASTVDERPVASALARLQAGQREEVVTLRHDMIRLDELSWRMLVLLDGTRGRAELADAMAALAGENRPRQEVESSLDRLLRQFAAHDLLTV